MSTYVILVAVEVSGSDREHAHQRVQAAMPRPAEGSGIHSWWVAEDDRTDGSDSDSAVFVHKGGQIEGSGLLYAEGLTARCNVVPYRGFESPRGNSTKGATS